MAVVPPQPGPTVPSSNPPKAVVLPAPQLSFTDTGLSVSDGVTVNGLWTVVSDMSWEYSLDQGITWTMGLGGQFEVTGDGPKMIWVRARDDLGNTSEIVKVSCVLDTMAPMQPSVDTQVQQGSWALQISGIEPGARWEYSVDQQKSWISGHGVGLAALGNALTTLWVRQVDLAGNVSAPQTVPLEQPASGAWQEASGNPLRPTLLPLQADRTYLIHGSVIRGDADYVSWSVPAGQRLASLRLIQYESEDAVAFFALQRADVFDAGVDVTRMAAYGHMGPQDLMRNVVAELPSTVLTEGPMTLWFQQTGPLPTRYVVELVLKSVPK